VNAHLSPHPLDDRSPGHADRPAPARPTGLRTRVHQVGAVLADLPLFAAAPLVRRRHLRWGSTDREVSAAMPGDERQPDARFRATRAISIEAPPEAVWPWLVQVGCGRAGWYSNDLLDNLGRPSATTILGELQHLEVDDWVPMAPSGPPTDRTALRVDSFDPPHWLLWTKPDSTWCWSLTPEGANGTRLVTRIHATYDWSHPVTAMLGLVLMELGDFAMIRRMLRGIRHRAESTALLDPPMSRDEQA